MPPQRTMPPAKAVKTERTHEENQERAYIAASRRSDRSLEARVESARRASEIHKKRTGRSLRVTEQDVVNEEMYEEEDDDLPLQYRRLTAHLQTGSADFNRRLAAYLANHVAMRSAIDQAITNSYAQQYPNAPQFAHNQQTMYPSGMIAPGMAMGMQPQQMHQQPQQQQQQQQRPYPPSSHPHPYRQSPYPLPGAAASYRQHAHNRSSSVAQAFDLPDYSQNSPVAPHPQTPIRRSSMPAPATSMSPATPTSSRPSLPPQTSQQVIAQKRASQPASDAESSTATQSTTTQSMGPPSTTISLNSAQHTPQPQARALPQAQTQAPPQSMAPPGGLLYNPQAFPDYGFFSTSLPPESQMLLGSTLNPNDPLTSLLMSGSENSAHSFYPNDLYNNFNPTNMMLKDHMSFDPSYDGMSATLAPSALSMSPSQPRNLKIESSSGADLSSTPSFSYGSDSSLGDYKNVNFNLGQSGSGHDSGTVTPGLDGGWDAFINDNSWSENAT